MIQRTQQKEGRGMTKTITVLLVVLLITLPFGIFLFTSLDTSYSFRNFLTGAVVSLPVERGSNESEQNGGMVGTLPVEDSPELPEEIMIVPTIEEPTQNIPQDIGTFVEVSGCGIITQDSELSGNINTTGNEGDVCFIINATNVTLDGQGYTLTGNGTGIGIRVAAYNDSAAGLHQIVNATIRNFSGINNFSIGINLTVYNSVYRGHSIYHNNITTSARLESKSRGIYMESGLLGINISENVIEKWGHNGSGISFRGSFSGNITGNNITSNGTQAPAIDSLAASSPGNIYIGSNTITTSGNNAIGIICTGSSCTVIIDSNNITTSGASSYGIRTGSAAKNISFNIIITTGQNSDGIVVGSSTNVTSNQINVSGTGTSAINLNSSAGSVVDSNTIVVSAGTSSQGIYLQASTGNNITFNTLNITSATINTPGIKFISSSNNNNVTS